jgi:two-component system, cell cycle sensor histidine kinase and response regulator CckA
MSDLSSQAPQPNDHSSDAVIDLMDQAIITVAPDGSIVRWNAGAVRLFGWSAGEVAGMKFEDLQTAGTAPSLVTVARRVMSGEPRWNGELPVVRKDGRTGKCEAVVIRMPDGGALLTLRETAVGHPSFEKVIEERRLLRTLIDAIPDFIFLKDREGRYLFRNRGERDGWGFSDSEFIGHTSLETPIAPEIGGRYYADDMTVIRTGEPVINRQEPFVLRDGRAGWFLTSKYPTRDNAGQITGLVGVARDITEFKRTSEELVTTRARLGAHLDHLLLAIIELDANLRVIRWAGRAAEIFGWSEEEALGRSIHEFNVIHPDDEDDVAAMLQSLIIGKEKSCVHENRNTDRHGAVHHCLWYNSVVQAPDGAVLSYLCLAQEITVQVEAVEKLKASDRLLQTLIDATNTGYALLDARGRILGVNGMYAAAFGLNQPGEFADRLFMSFIAPPQQEQFTLEMSRLLETGQMHNVEVDIVGAGGVVTPFELNAKVEHTDAGQRVHMFYRDITARRRATEENQALERKLLETQKLESLGVLAGGIAHDFNNLLTGILGNASLAATVVGSSSPVRPYLDQVEKASLRAADLCKQMLAYSGKGRFVVTETDINKLVHETTDLLRVSISKRATLHFKLSSPLPAVNADATQLRQVIMNLVINASEALGDSDGSITISTGTRRLNAVELAEAHAPVEATPGDYVWCEVVDSGCGMPPEVLARIFDPFFTTKFTGRGLGLAAVLGIVRSHRGALHVVSNPGRGTIFRVLLPSARRAAKESGGPPSTISSWRGSGTVLLVDDEETVRITTGRMLEGIGFSVITAGDGIEAVEAFAKHPGVRMVLLDLSMPRMDGVEAFREIRKIRPDARVLLMSGFTKIEAMKRFRMEGLGGFIQKPFTMRQLAEKAKASLTPS